MRYIKTGFFVILIFVVMAELTFRILSIFPKDSVTFVNDPNIGYRMRSGISVGNSTTNSFGFNDIEHSRENAEGHTRIAFIGDSFVFGAVPRQSNFTTIIQKLAEQSDKDIEVLNMGIPAAGPRNYLALIKDDVGLMDIDIVCVVFFVGNDITQSHPDLKTQVWLGSAREVLQHPFLLGFTGDYFYVYKSLRTFMRLIRERITRKPPTVTFSEKTFLSIERQRSIIFKIKQNVHLKRSYSESLIVLRQMAKVAEKNKIKFFVALAPDELQINKDLRNSLAEKYKMDLRDYDFDYPQKFFTEKLTKSGILTLDLLPSLVANKADSNLYLNQDTHWNVQGNRLVGEEIWSYIERHDLLF